MQNLYQDDQNDNGENGGEDKKEDNSRKKNDIQREMIMMDSDYKKVLNEKVALEAEIRKLKKEGDHIKLAMQERRQRLEKVSQDILQMEGVVKGLKKKLNLLT